MNNDNYFAVIDTETTWSNAVMSIGVVIADRNTFQPIIKKYYILSPEYKEGGMYSYVLLVKSEKVDLKGSRKKVIEDIIQILNSYNIDSIFAYNACFDYNHLPELHNYMWFDIMKMAAYRQYNKKIPENADCYNTGKLKRNYGVEPIMQLLSGNHRYHEVHNAICDAVDELRIIVLLGYSIDDYFCMQINSTNKTKAKSKSKSNSNQKPKEIQLQSQKKERNQTITKKESLTIDVCAEKNTDIKKYTVNNTIQHKTYGYGIIKRVEIINEEILLITVNYEISGTRLHLIPDSEQDIILIK